MNENKDRDVMTKTLLSDMQKCPACDQMVDPASLVDVVFHFFDGACVTGGGRREELEGIRGQKAQVDA